MSFLCVALFQVIKLNLLKLLFPKMLGRGEKLCNGKRYFWSDCLALERRLVMCFGMVLVGAQAHSI